LPWSSSTVLLVSGEVPVRGSLVQLFTVAFAALSFGGIGLLVS
jgi:hypothetical protein